MVHDLQLFLYVIEIDQKIFIILLLLEGRNRFMLLTWWCPFKIDEKICSPESVLI